MLKALLITLLLPALGQSPKAFAGPSDTDQQKLNLQLARQGLQMYYIHMRQFPSTDENLKSLWTNPGSKQWRGPYVLVDKTERDVWGTPLRYRAEGDSCTLTSAGPDQQFDTKDDIALAVAKPEERNPPKQGDQVYLDVAFADPKSEELPQLGPVVPQKYLVGDMTLSIYRAPFDDLNIAKLAKMSRSYTSMGLLVPHKETTSLEVAGRQLKVQATVLTNDQVDIKLAQNFVDFACNAGGYCRSDARLFLHSGDAVTIQVRAKHAEDPAYRLMILTPYIIRSPADFEQLQHHKQELAERLKSP